ncbi:MULTISPECIES: PE-PGRS family protein [unclassified Streptomyces]|uniref:PE-PGRS family protein n=1 Tax=unclassified Streptomyces TaxID=2593676 RepID=UPI000C2735A2|nr:PE-PGRS family protein [Streptomyces sp. CB01373]PJM97616.1 PE-PGRS family protein [Streptomyces sp. CB01373]
MNRVALGLAVGAGYLLGRTKKAKFALAVGSMVAGKKLNLGPRGIADLVNQQLMNNPQFKEIGDQLRQELRGVGKAASGALVERQMTALADRLHERTAQVRDELAGVVPQPGGDEESEGEDAYPDEGDGERRDEYEDEYDDREGREAEGEDRAESGDRGAPGRKEASGKAPAKKAPPKKTAKKTSAGAPARREAAKKAPAKKAPAQKAAAKKTATGRTAAKKTAAPGGATRAARSRRPKGGGDR